MCHSDTNKERFAISSATELEARLLAMSRQALESAPDCLAGVTVFGQPRVGKPFPFCVSLMDPKQARADGLLFLEFFTKFELVAVAMRNPGTWPAIELLSVMVGWGEQKARGDIKLVRAIADGSFERWTLYEAMHDKLGALLAKAAAI